MKLDHKIIAALLATSALAFGTAPRAEPGNPGAGCDNMGPKGMQGMGGMPGGPGMMRGAMMGDPAARVEQRLTMLKSDLKLTPQQEPLWQAYAEQMKAEAGQGMKAMREKTQDTALTAPERMNQMMNVMKERMTAMESVGASFKRLYDALTPEQKVIADKRAARMGPPHGPQGMREKGAERRPG